MFRGEHPLTLDDRGRIAVPTKYREQLHEAAGGVLVVTTSLMESCLVVYPFPEWLRIESKLQEMSPFDPQAHVFSHLLLGQATECEMDGHGRILLSQPLREFAGFPPDPQKADVSARRIRMIGQGRKFELWREDRWNESIEGMRGNVRAITSDPQSVVRSLVF